MHFSNNAYSWDESEEKKMKKRLLSIFLAVCLIFTLLPVSAFAATTASGTCGDNLTWTLDGVGTLTISGTGAMYDYYWTNVPWYDVRRNIGTRAFVDFLNSYCENHFDKFEKDYYDDSTKCIDIYNGHMSIDLDKLGKYLKKANRKTVSKELVNSYDDFMEYISYLYIRNEKLLEYIIDMQEDLL